MQFTNFTLLFPTSVLIAKEKPLIFGSYWDKVDGTVDFYCDWADYECGFVDLDGQYPHTHQYW